MIAVYLFLGFITIYVIAQAIYNVLRAEELDEREDELDKYSVHRDERDNRIAADEKTLRELYKELKAEIEKQKK